MSDTEHLRIGREELFTTEVDEALAREQALRRRVMRESPDVPAWRRVINNSLVYLPVAAMLGALGSWLTLEPYVDDMSLAGGTIAVIDADPMAANGYTSLTLDRVEVLIDKGAVLERGADGQKPIASIDDLSPGDVVEVSGVLVDGQRMLAAAIRPATREHAQATGVRLHGDFQWGMTLFFPLTATLIALAVLLAEGLTTRNWVRMIQRTLVGSFLAMLFSVLAFIPAGMALQVQRAVLDNASGTGQFVTVRDLGVMGFVLVAASRSVAWACIGAALGVGMNLVRSTRVQLRNSVIGGALGGALGGLFFDPIDRFGPTSFFVGGDASRLVGVLAVGVCVGVFLALVERLAREAWLRVRTGPLAGKAFVLYKTPTLLGSSPQADVYLFKDADIDPEHATLHRVGAAYEIEDLGSRHGTTVGGQSIRRRRLVSGDQIVMGATVVDFEERQTRTGS